MRADKTKRDFFIFKRTRSTLLFPPLKKIIINKINFLKKKIWLSHLYFFPFSFLVFLVRCLQQQKSNDCHLLWYSFSSFCYSLPLSFWLSSFLLHSFHHLMSHRVLFEEENKNKNTLRATRIVLFSYFFVVEIHFFRWYVTVRKERPIKHAT